MAGRKRAAADDSPTGKRETRSSKVAKTESAKAAGKAAKGTARLKTSMTQSAFKSCAVPLHVSITTTAPAPAPAPEGQEPFPADPGFLANTALVPTTFATGSFGWKCHKRLVVVLPNAEGEGEGERLHVALTFNATVIGSKDVREGEEHEGTGERAAEEVSSDAVKHGDPPRPEVRESEGNLPVGEEQVEEGAS